MHRARARPPLHRTYRAADGAVAGVAHSPTWEQGTLEMTDRGLRIAALGVGALTLALVTTTVVLVVATGGRAANQFDQPWAEVAAAVTVLAGTTAGLASSCGVHGTGSGGSCWHPASRWRWRTWPCRPSWASGREWRGANDPRTVVAH